MENITTALGLEYQKEIDVLGRSAQTRMFLLSLLLTSRFHISSRPISDSNSLFFVRLATSCDALLNILREDGWEPVSEQMEFGLQKLDPVSGHDHAPESQVILKRRFRAIYHKYFRGLNWMWSSLAPSKNLKITDGPDPKQILICVGPNIGIGDEIIFFELAVRLRRQFPFSKILTSSFNESVWDLCHEVDDRSYQNFNQLRPYAEAVQLLESDPNNLVFFVEFACTAAYRHLELLPGLSRFVYIDTGARTARIVEQQNHKICEIRGKGNNVYQVLDRMLSEIGLPEKTPLLADASTKPVSYNAQKKTVFVNPYSSKNYKELPPSWWSDALKQAAALVNIDAVVIFAGTSTPNREYARQIFDGCREASLNIELYGENHLPSIAEMMLKAASSSVIFGLDTFTGHVGMISTTPCVTVFFGSEWDAWHVYNNHVLNVHIHDFPQQVGKLVARMLLMGNPKERHFAIQMLEETERFSGKSADAGAAFDVFLKLRKLLTDWHQCDPDLHETFVDIAPEQASVLESALHQALANRAAQNTEVQELINEALKKWSGSNIYRYSKFLAAQI